MISISKTEEFDLWIRKQDGVKIIRFCADWSGPCHIMGPIFKELSWIYENLATFYEVDVEKAPLLQREYEITEIPTILIFRNGDLMDFIKGLQSREALKEKLEKVIRGE